MFEGIADELQRRGVVEVLDRKDRVEHSLQSDALPLLHLHAGLEEAVKGLLLNLEEIRDLDDRRHLRKVLANAGRELGESNLRHGL